MQWQRCSCESCFGGSFCDVQRLRKFAGVCFSPIYQPALGLQNVQPRPVVECRKNPLRRLWFKHKVREHWI